METCAPGNMIPGWIHKVEPAHCAIITLSGVQEGNNVLSLSSEISDLREPPRNDKNIYRENHVVEIEQFVKFNACFAESI